MELIQDIKSKLDSLFDIYKLDKDPAFSRFLPIVYDSIGFDWETEFESDFITRFNGLMIQGSDEVNTIFLAVFPTTDVVTDFIEEASEGDMLFMHHPIPMECGDPRGKWGRGFVPVDPDLIKIIKEKKLSVYTCHAPLDYNRQIGTSDAIAEALNAKIVDQFMPYGNGYAGLICEIPNINTKQLIEELKELIEIPYVDFEGYVHKTISKIAIVAGCGDVISEMQLVEEKGVQAYITGEIHCHIDNEYGKKKYGDMMDYVMETQMSLIGVSHSASEFFVMKTQMKKWLQEETKIQTKLLRQRNWWL
jgi:putative NIF3 family GTP cyclohydrolase 1 type 2